MKYRKAVLRFNLFFLMLLLLFSAPAVAETENFEENVVLHSQKLRAMGNESFIFEGNVLLLYDEFTLEADQVFLDYRNGYGKASGKIRAIYNDIKLFTNELEFDFLLGTVKTSETLVNLNNLAEFKADSIFVTKEWVRIEKFIFKDSDPKLPFGYELVLDKLNVLPIYNNRYFYIQTEKINGNLLGINNILPLSFPAYDFYLRNPGIPRNYITQRRLRGFYEPGSFFVQVGSDGYNGPWLNSTIAYFSNSYSNGFFSGQYGLFSGLELSLYQDLTDIKGNLIQANAAFRQYDRILKTPLAYGSLRFLHDWEYDTLQLNLSFNQSYSNLIINKIPEVTFYSIFREFSHGISYRYNLSATRYLVNDTKENKSVDLSRIRLSTYVNSPRFDISKNLHLQLLEETIYTNFLQGDAQFGLGGQLILSHEILSNLDYALHYRQRFAWGNSPLSIEELNNNQYTGFLLKWWLLDFVELSFYSEFNLNSLTFSTINLAVNYFTNHYSILAYLDLVNLGFNTNFKFIDF